MNRIQADMSRNLSSSSNFCLSKSYRAHHSVPHKTKWIYGSVPGADPGFFFFFFFFFFWGGGRGQNRLLYVRYGLRKKKLIAFVQSIDPGQPVQIDKTFRYQ